MSSFLSPLYQLQYIQLVHNIPISGGHVIPSNELTGKVEFRNITFSYPSRPDQVMIHIIIIHVHVMVTCSMKGTKVPNLAAVSKLFINAMPA